MYNRRRLRRGRGRRMSYMRKFYKHCRKLTRIKLGRRGGFGVGAVSR